MKIPGKLFLAAVILAIIIAGWWFWHSHPSNEASNEPAAEPISQVYYLCQDNKTIDAAYYTGHTAQTGPGEPPIPGGSVSLILSDGRQLELHQTISASGIRYANEDESFVFWSKGNGAFITEGGQTTYSDCIAIAPDTDGTLPQIYADAAKGFSIRYPAGYTLDANYQYQALGPGKEINGVKFIIPALMATGTNLSSFDTGVSVEQIPDEPDCNAGLFVYPGAKVELLSDNGVNYSVATTTDAGAGNFYEEHVWAIPGTNPCTAIRYLIHYTNIYNYTPGMVKEFDKSALINKFDKIRRSLILL